mmetsp:Transcript_101384/g.217114  ORF Transcript_101384/g.217114 Transcript_101384/m.217114 type:complete len:218 (-) Transcript_101384:215-868(-)
MGPVRLELPRGAALASTAFPAHSTLLRKQPRNGAPATGPPVATGAARRVSTGGAAATATTELPSSPDAGGALFAFGGDIDARKGLRGVLPGAPVAQACRRVGISSPRPNPLAPLAASAAAPGGTSTRRVLGVTTRRLSWSPAPGARTEAGPMVSRVWPLGRKPGPLMLRSLDASEVATSSMRGVGPAAAPGEPEPGPSRGCEERAEKAPLDSCRARP